MSQPIPANPSASPEPDPLGAFFAEESEAAGSIEAAAAARPEKPSESAPPAEPVPAVELARPRHQPTDDMRLRVDRAERLLERSLIEITTLKSDLATLVAAVEDIKKRQSRRDPPAAPMARPAKKMSPWRAALAAVALLTFATLAWGLAAIVSEDPPPPTIESESAPVEVPRPAVDAAPPAGEIQTPATVPAPPATIARSPDVAGRADPPPARTAPRYVGTLTIDASPAGEVFLDRQSVGHTPLRLEKLRAGSHLIWIQREGYRRWTRVVPVTANRVSRVSATLDPIPR